MYPSEFEELIGTFQKLPGVGSKTAERYAYTLLNMSPSDQKTFIDGINKIKKIKYCKTCGNLSSSDLCSVCADPSRNHRLITVVENPKDVSTFEKMDDYNGVYHVLHGVINTQKGVLPDNLNIQTLRERISKEPGQNYEVVLALNPNMQGETTALYLSRFLNGIAKVSRLAYGIPVGGNLDYVDPLTLQRAFEGRKES